MPDAGIALLIIDEAPGGDAVPWSVLRRKLAPGARVVAVTSAIDGIASHADYVMPAPVFPETSQDVAACDSPPHLQPLAAAGAPNPRGPSSPPNS